jgi:hypothetical protein
LLECPTTFYRLHDPSRSFDALPEFSLHYYTILYPSRCASRRCTGFPYNKFLKSLCKTNLALLHYIQNISSYLEGVYFCFSVILRPVTPSYPASLFKLPVSDLLSASPYTDLYRTRVTSTPISIQIDSPRAACRSSIASPSLAVPLPLCHQTFLAHAAIQRMPSKLAAPPTISLILLPPPILSVLGLPVLIFMRSAISSFSPRVLQPCSNFPIAHLHS